MFERLTSRAKTDADNEKLIYYTLVDCCSGQSYIYPQGHYLAGYAIYMVYDGTCDEICPENVITNPGIITSVTDSLGFEIKGCFILKATTRPEGNPPVNLQNWADVFYTNLQTTQLCCDCNSSCGSLFFQFTNIPVIDYGQFIFPFVGPTGNYNGRNYYQIVFGSFVFYVWYSTQDQIWYLTDTLGDSTGAVIVLDSTNQIPAEFNTITNWDNQFTALNFQSYICKIEEPVVATLVTTIPEEKYQLTCCSTGEALVINGLPAIFVFNGLTSNNNHPDDYLEVVLTTIKDINANVITGCYRVTEAECFEEWEEILWQDFFVETECVNTCKECLPKPAVIPPITNHKIIYPDFIVNNAESFDAEKIFCAFGDANYEKVLALRFGVQFCCPTDLMQSTIEHEILKMDIAEDVNACCPVEPLPGTCKKYTITIPVDVEGWLYFKDCSGIVRTVLFYAASQPHEVFVCGVTGQTTAEIYILTTSHNLLQVQFVEGIDCN
jgi:hypothetical protein